MPGGLDAGTIYSGAEFDYGKVVSGVAAMKAALASGNAGLASFESNIAATQKAIEGLGSIMSQAFDAGPLGELFMSAGKAAAQVEVLNTVLHVVGKNTGQANEVLDEQVKAIERLGITAAEARQTLIQFMQSELDTADAIKLTQVAQDLAVIANEDSSETLQRLVHSIGSLELELLKPVGLMKTIRSVTEDYANTVGKTVSELTVYEQKQAVLNYILTEGQKVSGAYEEAMGNVGIQMTSLPRLFENAKVALGNGFLPTLSEGVMTLNHFLEWFSKLPPTALEVIAKVIMVGTAVAGASAAFSAFSAVLSGPAGWIALALAGAAAIMQLGEANDNMAWSINNAADSALKQVNGLISSANEWGRKSQSLLDLADTYDRLTDKAKKIGLTAKEQETLNQTLVELRKQAPGAASVLDDYGRAVEFDSTKVREAALAMANLQKNQLTMAKAMIEAQIPYLNLKAKAGQDHLTELQGDYNKQFEQVTKLVEIQTALMDKTKTLAQKIAIVKKAVRDKILPSDAEYGLDSPVKKIREAAIEGVLSDLDSGWFGIDRSMKRLDDLAKRLADLQAAVTKAQDAKNQLEQKNLELQVIEDYIANLRKSKPTTPPEGGADGKDKPDPAELAKRRMDAEKEALERTVELLKAQGVAESEAYKKALEDLTLYEASRKKLGPALTEDEMKTINEIRSEYQHRQAVAEAEEERERRDKKIQEEKDAETRRLQVIQDFADRNATISDEMTERKVAASRKYFKDLEADLLVAGFKEATIKEAETQEIASIYAERAQVVVDYADKCTDAEIAASIEVLQATAAKYRAMGDEGKLAYEVIMAEIEQLANREVEYLVGKQEDLTEAQRQEAIKRIEIRRAEILAGIGGGEATPEQEKELAGFDAAIAKLRAASNAYWGGVQQGYSQVLKSVLTGQKSITDLLKEGGESLLGYFADVVAGGITAALKRAAETGKLDLGEMLKLMQQDFGATIKDLEKQLIDFGSQLGLSPEMSKFLGGIGIGTMLGTAVGGDPISSLLGSTIGAAIGQFIFPVIGPILGGILGGLLGGLFGKKKEEPEEEPLVKLKRLMDEYNNFKALAESGNLGDEMDQIFSIMANASWRAKVALVELQKELGLTSTDLAEALSSAFSETDYNSFLKGWKNALYKETFNALYRAFMAQSMQPMLDELGKMIAAAVANGVISPEELEALKEQMAEMEPQMAAFWEVLQKLFPELFEATGGAGAGGGTSGYQITEFTGPAADKLTTLLTPLEQIYNLVGLVGDIRAYLLSSPAGGGLVVQGNLSVTVAAEDVLSGNDAARVIFESASREMRAKGA